MRKRKSIVKVLTVTLIVGALVLLVNAGEKPEKEKVVPRNRTLISVGGGGEALLEFSNYESWNPYFLGHIAASGAQLFLEPLFFFFRNF